MYPTFLVDRHVAILQTHETLFPILFRIPDVKGAFDREGTDLTTDEQQKKQSNTKIKPISPLKKQTFQSKDSYINKTFETFSGDLRLGLYILKERFNQNLILLSIYVYLWPSSFLFGRFVPCCFFSFWSNYLFVGYVVFK